MVGQKSRVSHRCSWSDLSFIPLSCLTSPDPSCIQTRQCLDSPFTQTNITIDRNQPKHRPPNRRKEPFSNVLRYYRNVTHNGHPYVKSLLYRHLDFYHTRHGIIMNFQVKQKDGDRFRRKSKQGRKNRYKLGIGK